MKFGQGKKKRKDWISYILNPICFIGMGWYFGDLNVHLGYKEKIEVIE